jgi:hypothetical protein
MKRSTLSVIVFVLLTHLLSGCGPTSEPELPEFTTSPEIPTSTPEPTRTPTVTPTVTPTPTPTATPVGGSGMLYFNVYSDLGNMGVFAADLGSLTLTRITDEGFWLEAVSPRGHKILLSTRDGQLITANPDGSDQKIIAQNLSTEKITLGQFRALWIPEIDRVLFVGQDQGQDFIYSVRDDGEDLQKISQQGMKILWLYKTNSNSTIAWQRGFSSGAGTFFGGAWIVNIDGSNQKPMENIHNPIFSPNGDRLIAEKYVVEGGIGQSVPFIMMPDLSGEVQLVNPLGERSYLDALFWVESGRRILVEGNVCNTPDDDGFLCDEHHLFLYSESGDLDREVQIGYLDSYSAAVSPDGLTIANVAYQGNGEEVISLIDLTSLSVTQLELSPPEGSKSIWNVHWLPR